VKNFNMKKMIFIISIFLLTACGGSSDPGFLIWSLSSQRLVIYQHNGNVPSSEERTKTYDYSLDNLPTKSKEKLSSMRTTSNSLACHIDGTSYRVTITESSGVEKIYYSSDSACNNTAEFDFIKTKDIKELITLLTN